MFPADMRLLMKFAVMSALLEYCQTYEKASFYGASYIHLPVQEAKGATDISFRFRTHLSDAMLMLAAGKTDYCLIKLEAGKLKVHINLGAGENEIASARGLTLNDLAWHEVNLTRREANVSLKIDAIHSTRSVLPGRFFELNIHYGIFIGGLGDFNELFLGHVDYLRGCMSDIVYNGIEVMNHVRARKGQSEATSISWGCSAEFDASRDSEMSFIEDGAFLAVPKPISRSGSKWEFDLKTTASSGLLFYNPGQSSFADYLGIELTGGKIRLLMNKGNGPTELIHNANVSDGKWHHVVTDFTPSNIGISVDSQEKVLTLPSGGNRFLDLTSTFYVGGTELNKRAKALAKGLKSGIVSYKGCLRGMLLDNKEFGLPDVQVSQGVIVGCVWEYPCVESTPCVPGSTCSQWGVDSFKCDCDQTICAKPNHTQKRIGPSLPERLEILELKPLVVSEGSHALLTSEHVVLILDAAKYNVQETKVTFNLISPPSHGSLDLLATTSDYLFTLQDLNNNQIQYIHDGSEFATDNATLELTLQPASGYSLPQYLQQQLKFLLRINVIPVNDPPIFEIPPAKVLRLAQGTRKVLGKEFVWAVDPDTPSQELIYTVLRESDTEAGYVERLAQPSKPITTFTQAELERGLVAYVHRGGGKPNVRLGLQVNDGFESSQPAFLRISAYPLQLKMLRNTGLVVVHRSFSYIGSANLSFGTNSDDPSITVRYDIVTQPQNGAVQRLENNATGSWSNVDHFTSDDLELQSVRYIHNLGSPAKDDFKFQVSVREVRSQQSFYFRIEFIDLELKEVRRNALSFAKSIEATLSAENLKYETNPLPTSSSRILYAVLRAPRFGNLFSATRKLTLGDSFSQEDLDAGRVKYRLHRKAFSAIEDFLGFNVTAPQCAGIVSELKLSHTVKNFKEIRENLQIQEGSKVALSTPRVGFKDLSGDLLTFNVTLRPQHGSVTRSINSEFNQANITAFSSKELTNSSILYVHDDSESREDSFQYLAMAGDFMYVGYYSFDVILKNDNPPERSFEKVFHVVSNGQRLLTNKDLLYKDKDVDSKPSDLKYLVKTLENGRLLRKGESSKELTSFTQKEIDDLQVLFQHQGQPRGVMEFDVTDGHFHTPGSLQILASEPYVKLERDDNAFVVRFNGSVALSPKDLEIETNVNATPDEVFYQVVDKPRHGVLRKHEKEVPGFSQEDVNQGRILYEHSGGSSKSDRFKVKVSVRGAENESVVSVRIYPQVYWEPLTVQSNKPILVEEATSVLLSRKYLEIMHPKISAEEIVFLVREWPQFGYLELQEESNEDPGGSQVKSFTQSLVNDGKVWYVQSVSNQTFDNFVVDVTNGITWLRGLQVGFVVVPDKLYIEAKVVQVVEGKEATLSASDFHVTNSYFKGKVTDYRILEKPKHGFVQDTTKNAPIKKFSQKHLNANVICYRHNGDEHQEDSFKMIAIAGDKTSEIVEVRIEVLPVNDEVPVLVNRSNFAVWQGGSVLLNSTSLGAVDNDTVPREIVFNLTWVENGFFSLVGLPEVEIFNFTQDQIDHSKVLFTHINATDAKFSFFLFDGIHSTEVHTIQVNTIPVRLELRNNNVLNVFPLTRKLFSEKLLLTSCSDDQREIKYLVRNPPRMGNIIMETGEGDWLRVDKFTQKDINNSKVAYEHTKQFMDLFSNDSFTFDIEAHFAGSLTNQVLRIDISVSSGGLDRYLSMKPVRVEEGGTGEVAMNVSGIVRFLQVKSGIGNPVVLSKLTNQPEHGHVMLLPDLNVTTFTQPQIEGGKVAYFHDHSDTLRDQIPFSIYLSPGHILLCNTTIPVLVSPVNDQPFKLVTVAPYITVVQNQNQTITRENLLTTDPDTSPEEIVYDIISGPTFGRLLLFNANDSEVQQVNKFSQNDVDSNRLVYEHNGPLQAASFYFRVSDGRFNPIYTVFNVHVLSIKLEIVPLEPVKLQQGSNVALISEENWRLDTNARQELVTYTVTVPPKHGVIYVRDTAVKRFKHGDVSSKNVVFMQTDMTVSRDSFQLSVDVNGLESRYIQAEVKVVPLMIMNPLTVIVGEKTRLSLQHLDATPLAELTGSNPLYTVTQKPKYAKVKRIIKNTVLSGEKRGVREKEVSRFHHQEVVSGVIYLVSRKIPTLDYEGVADSLGFVLAASIFQPAIGEFAFRVKLDLDEHGNNTLGGPMDPVGHEGEIAIAPNMSNDYLLILGMLLGVFFLGVIVIITIRCRHNRYKSEDEDKGEASPVGVGVMPLPRPPDHLMPTTPHLKRFANEHNSSGGGGGIASSTPLPSLPTSTLPQCKVIPLSPIESITGSEMDVSGSRYPYGVADGEDGWSSFDASETPCQSAGNQRTNPLLRRNQYWV